jgi:HD-GYP domain-containing protein (c-di-GMP phosphodiesterase class II)
VTNRAYREGLKLEKALEILSQEAKDSKLDEEIVGKLIEVVREDRRSEDTDS